MNSKIAEAIRMKYSPVAILWSNEKPDGALEFKEERRGCVMSLLSAAAKGRTAVASEKTCGCNGGLVGMGFGCHSYEKFPGGIEYFLSTGNPEFCKTELGKKISEAMPDFEHGEGYIKTPTLAKKFAESLPVRDIPATYVVFKPLDYVTEDEQPKTVIFLVNPDRLSALIVLANYGRETTDNVIAPMGAACHQIGILPYREAESESPRAVIGLTDISARKVLRSAVDRDTLSFAIPYAMFNEMEENVEGSFLERESWATLIGE